MKEYPWITVECEYSAWDGWQDKVATQLAGGTAPGLMQINWNWLYQYSSDGSKFADLNNFSDTITLGNFPETNLEAMTVGGKLQGVPISVSSKLYFFNKTTFDKAGIAIPTTPDELLEAGRVFKEKLEMCIRDRRCACSQNGNRRFLRGQAAIDTGDFYCVAGQGGEGNRKSRV